MTIKVCQSSAELNRLEAILNNSKIPYEVKPTDLSIIQKKLVVDKKVFGRAIIAIKKAI